MTRQTNGMPELKYSEEVLRDKYEALKLYQKHQEGTSVHYCSECYAAINNALAKGEVK